MLTRLCRVRASQDTLEFRLAKYSMFGEFLGIETLNNQFFYCDASKGRAPAARTCTRAAPAARRLCTRSTLCGAVGVA